MTPQELEQYLALTQEIDRLEAELETAVKSRQALAKTLYERHGKGYSYKVGDEYLIVAPTKTGTYYFAPRVRWPKEARAAKAEQKRLDRLARMQRPPFASEPAPTPEPAQTPEPAVGRVIEITATLSRKADPQISDLETPKITLRDGTPLPTLEDDPLASAEPEGGSGGMPSVVNPSPEVTAPPTPEPPATPLEIDPSKRHLPLVGDVDKPTQIEPRLLQIEEPREPEPADDLSKPEDDLLKQLGDLDDLDD